MNRHVGSWPSKARTLSIAPYSVSTTSRFVNFILQGSSGALASVWPRFQKERAALAAGQRLLPRATAGDSQPLAAHPSRDFRNAHLKGPVPLPCERKIKLYHCLFLKMPSFI